MRFTPNALTINPSGRNSVANDREDKGAARQRQRNAGNLIVEDINAVPQVLQGFKIPQKLIEPVIDPRALSFAQKECLQRDKCSSE